MRNATRTQDVLLHVEHERALQDEKFGTNFPDRPTELWLMIALEEIGEALSEPAGSQKRYRELIQCAAVFASWAEHDRDATDDFTPAWRPFMRYYAESGITQIIKAIGTSAQKRLDARFPK